MSTAKEEHPYTNKHIEPICEPCLDFRLNWTMTASELSTWRAAAAHLSAIAAEHFTADRDKEAYELKRIVKEIQEKRIAPLSKKLDEYIKEGSR